MIEIVILLFSIVINTRKESKTMDHNISFNKIKVSGTATVIPPEDAEEEVEVDADDEEE